MERLKREEAPELCRVRDTRVDFSSKYCRGARGTDTFFSTDIGHSAADLSLELSPVNEEFEVVSRKTVNPDEEAVAVEENDGRVDCRTEAAIRGFVHVVRWGREASCFCLGDGFFVSTLTLNGFSWRCFIC